MHDDVATWLRYAEENLKVALLCLENGFYNPALQNAQQAVEKALKAACLIRGVPVKKTHSIRELTKILDRAGLVGILSKDEYVFLDSIYLPSKYPLGSVLPHSEPSRSIAAQSVSIAESVLATIHSLRKSET